MKEIKLSDPYRSLTIRMCEKHFSSYRPQMDKAMSGGTSYAFISTNKRGCELCRKKKNEKGRHC